MSEWKLYKLGEIARFQTGKLNSNAAIEGGKYPFSLVLLQLYTLIITLLIKKRYCLLEIMQKVISRLNIIMENLMLIKERILLKR